MVKRILWLELLSIAELASNRECMIIFTYLYNYAALWYGQHLLVWFPIRLSTGVTHYNTVHFHCIYLIPW